MKINCPLCKQKINVKMFRYFFIGRKIECDNCLASLRVKEPANTVIIISTYLFMVLFMFVGLLYKSFFGAVGMVFSYYVFELLKLKFLEAEK
ncbi:MAG: hypothetical protein B0W54_21535 [Cellvibrio sp. 79]|nr:MAG: hypothetical protein B0W54_21535 [Cellvibrio sp. 79]